MKSQPLSILADLFPEQVHRAPFPTVVRNFFFSKKIFLEEFLSARLNGLPGEQKNKKIAHIKFQKNQSSSKPLKFSLKLYIAAFSSQMHGVHGA